MYFLTTAFKMDVNAYIMKLDTLRESNICYGPFTRYTKSKRFETIQVKHMINVCTVDWSL